MEDEVGDGWIMVSIVKCKFGGVGFVMSRCSVSLYFVVLYVVKGGVVYEIGLI